MNTDPKSLTRITDLKTSSALAGKLARALHTPQLLELVGDLGGGKTTFTKALGKALGIEKTITSPTFNIHRQYKYAGGVLEHFDLYRLRDDEMVLGELQECLADSKSVTVVEWGQNFSGLKDYDKLIVRFEYIDEEKRKLTFSATGKKSQELLRAIA